jgi:hypothetical protein
MMEDLSITLTRNFLKTIQRIQTITEKRKKSTNVSDRKAAEQTLRRNHILQYRDAWDDEDKIWPEISAGFSYPALQAQALRDAWKVKKEEMDTAMTNLAWSGYGDVSRRDFAAEGRNAAGRGANGEKRAYDEFVHHMVPFVEVDPEP